MHRSYGGLAALAITIVVAACTSFGTGSGPPSTNQNLTDAAPPSASQLVDGGGLSEAGEAAALCDVGACAAGCTKYTFTPGMCPPTDWKFAGDAPGKQCSNNRLRLFAEGSLDATAQLTTRTPGSLSGARIELRLAITRWAHLSGERSRVLVAGAQTGTGIAITAIENALRNYDLQLCRVDGSGDFQNCINFTTITAKAEHVVSLDWSASGFNAIIDCQTQATQPTSPINGNQDFGLIFGLNDAAPIDGTIGDVSVSFR